MDASGSAICWGQRWFGVRVFKADEVNWVLDPFFCGADFAPAPPLLCDRVCVNACNDLCWSQFSARFCPHLLHACVNVTLYCHELTYLKKTVPVITWVPLKKNQACYNRIWNCISPGSFQMCPEADPAQPYLYLSSQLNSEPTDELLTTFLITKPTHDGPWNSPHWTWEIELLTTNHVQTHPRRLGSSIGLYNHGPFCMFGHWLAYSCSMLYRSTSTYRCIINLHDWDCSPRFWPPCIHMTYEELISNFNPSMDK